MKHRRPWELIMFKRFLVAIDGSPTSSAGFKAALQPAKDQEAELVSLNLVDESLIIVSFDGHVPAPYIDGYFNSMQEYGRQFARKGRGSRPRFRREDSAGSRNSAGAPRG
jgi:hypothetical protein